MNEEGGSVACHHGAQVLPSVTVDAYNAELDDPHGEGFLGDRASNRSFVKLLETWRERVRQGSGGKDPLRHSVGEDIPTHEIDRAELDALLHAADEDPEAAGLVHSAIEDFAQEMAVVVGRFLQLSDWHDTECFAVGGGFLEARVGLMAVGRVGILLKASGNPIKMVPVSRHPDDAALCGAVHLAPPALLEGCDTILAADIGGTNVRAGLVEFRHSSDDKLPVPQVVSIDRWRHGSDAPDRDEAVERLAEMLCKLANEAKEHGRRLTPFVGIGCPGVIRADGTIERGGQNLPGDWEEPGFNLPRRLARLLPELAGREPQIVVHNDAVVQGLSEVGAMQSFRHWGVFTIGTGLGNARYTNRSTGKEAR